MKLEREELTKEIIGAAFEVHNTLGYGFLEKVYQNAMLLELRLRGLSAESEKLIQVYYKNQVVGDYRADLSVEDVLVELKVAAEYNRLDEAQLLNELAATQAPVALLINFGREKVEFKRFILSNRNPCRSA